MCFSMDDAELTVKCIDRILTGWLHLLLKDFLPIFMLLILKNKHLLKCCITSSICIVLTDMEASDI